ncbi:MAG: ribonuclease J [Erysipelotrichaceae bacterium]|nr:ribonuclease J [Erysipelotrichaceae bacterium]
MSKARIMALGGLSEDGKNMYVFEIDEDIFIVDCGIKYPNTSEQLGIEYIIPDFRYILENKDRVKAVFITHGHDDVMAALPYLLQELDVDVYATALTARILEREFASHGLRKKVKVVKRNSSLNVAGHKVYTFSVTQSIADGIGIAFETGEGLIVYSSEFINDYDMINDAFTMSIESLSQLHSRKVLALLSESVGANKPGFTSPKHRITSIVERYFGDASKRIVITLYKQNLFRIIEVLELARKYKRKVFFSDPDHVRILKDVEELGYYRMPSGLLLDRKNFRNDDPNTVVIVSGSGNEVFTHMNRIALGDDQVISLSENDQVIIASPIVPGTEKEGAAMEDDLYIAGIPVAKIGARDVLSMHASVEDLKMMLNTLQPRYYIPVKGNYTSLIANAEIALQMGVTPDRIIILDNGQFATLEGGKLTSTHDTLTLNDTLISGRDKLDIGGMVIKDRETLSTDGAIVLGVVLDFATKELIGGPDIQSRGVIYLKDADYILEEVGNLLITTIQEMVAEGRYDNMKARSEAKEKISRYVLKQTGKRPMILPAIVEINTEG